MNKAVLALAFVLAAISSTTVAAAECPYESRLEGIQSAEELALQPGISLPIDHITVCRNGAAVFLRERDGGPQIVVRFIRANQDSFKRVLGSQYAIEKRISFGRSAEQPSLVADIDGKVVLTWKEQSIQIVGERLLYILPSDCPLD